MIRLISVLLLSAFLINGCKKDDDKSPDLNTSTSKLEASDLLVAFPEYTPNGTNLGEISAVNNRDELRYILIKQSPLGAITLDSNTGTVQVLDSNYFDYELNTGISALVQVNDGFSIDTSIIYIDIIDKDESRIKIFITSCNGDSLLEYQFDFKYTFSGKSQYGSNPKLDQINHTIEFNGLHWVYYDRQRGAEKPFFINDQFTQNTFPPRDGWVIRKNNYCNPNAILKIQ